MTNSCKNSPIASLPEGITSKHYSMPDGTEFVGYGVSPDVAVYETVAAFREGRDLVLEKAVEVLE